MGSNRHDDVQVEVLLDGTWWPGWLDPDDWAKTGGRWHAMVRYQTGVAENMIREFDQDQIRRV